MAVRGGVDKVALHLGKLFSKPIGFPIPVMTVLLLHHQWLVQQTHLMCYQGTLGVLPHLTWTISCDNYIILRYDSHIHIYIHTHTHTHTNTHTYMYVCLYIYIYVCMFVYIYICVCVCVCVYIYIYTHTNTHPHPHPHTYIYMYTFLTTTGSIQDSSAGTMTKLHTGWLRDQGLIPGNGKNPQCPDWLWGTPCLLPEAQGAESCSWPLISVSGEVKNLWRYTSSPPYGFQVQCLSTEQH